MKSRQKKSVPAVPPASAEGTVASRAGAMGTVLFATFALGLVASGVHPDPRLWGVHQFAFLSRTAWALAAAVLAALLIPDVARVVGRGAGALGSVLLRFWTVSLPLGVLLLIAAFTWRMGYPFQGDGMVWVGALKEGKEFHHFEPLAATLVRFVAMTWSPRSPETAAGVLSVLLGPGYVVGTAWLCRMLFADALSAGVAWLLLLLHPMLLLFFGYVESYPLVIVFEVLFALCAVGSARRRLPLVVPALVLGLAMAAHLTALAWSPVLLVLAWERDPGHSRRGLASGVLAVLLALVVAVSTAGAVGSSPSTLLRNLVGQPGLGGQSLSWMFSWRHVLDLLNELTLLLAPALVLLAAAQSRRLPAVLVGEGASPGKQHAAPEGDFASPAWRTMLALLPGPLAVALLVEPRIGGGRDWDLYLPLVLPVVLLAVEIWRPKETESARVAGAKGVKLQPRRGALAGLPRAWADAGRAVGLAGVVWMGWLAMGLDESIAARRLEVLQESRGTFSNFARGYANETLGIYYRGRDSNASRAAWLRATQANPSNPRYFNNLGIEELRRDDVDAACAAFHRTLELGMEEYFVLFNVANCNRRTGQYEKAEALYDRLIDGWPQRWEAFGARGLVRVKLGRVSEAMDDLRIALRLAPNEAETHYTMGLAHQALGQMEEARQEWERALALDPKHAGARQQLDMLQQGAAP